MESLWTYIQSLSLSKKNKRWLADRLISSTNEGERLDREQAKKEELAADLEQSCREALLYKEGKIELLTLSEALDEIRH